VYGYSAVLITWSLTKCFNKAIIPLEDWENINKATFRESRKDRARISGHTAFSVEGWSNKLNTLLSNMQPRSLGSHQIQSGRASGP
jgi:hypothetical protein